MTVKAMSVHNPRSSTLLVAHRFDEAAPTCVGSGQSEWVGGLEDFDTGP